MPSKKNKGSHGIAERRSDSMEWVAKKNTGSHGIPERRSDPMEWVA